MTGGKTKARKAESELSEMGCHWDEVQSLSIWALGFKVIFIPLEVFHGKQQKTYLGHLQC